MKRDETEAVAVWQSLRHVISMGTLAKMLGIRQTSVFGWKRVPHYRVAEVSEILHVPPETLRPDLYAEQNVPAEPKQMSMFDSHA